MKEISLNSPFENVMQARNADPDGYARFVAFVEAGSVSPLEEAKKALQESPTPETVSAFLNEFWGKKAKEAGADLTLGDFPGSQDDLNEHIKRGDMVISVPKEVAEDPSLLTILFPEYEGHYALSANSPYVNQNVKPGYFYTPASIDAPNPNTTEDELKERLGNDERQTGGNIINYFIAGQISEELTGEFLDQNNTSVRLLDTSKGGRVVNAEFLPDGRFKVHSNLFPRHQDGYLGGRVFEGVDNS